MIAVSRIVCASLAACMFAACSHPPQATDPVLPGPFAGVHLASNDLWSGGDVTVISSSFKSLVILPSVQVAGVARTARRINDSTIAATLPDTDATLGVHVQADSFLAFDASVTVHGFQQIRVGPMMPGGVQAVPGQAMVVGAGATGLIELNLRTNTIQRQFPDTVHSFDCMKSVGASVQPGHFVFYGKTPAGGGVEACTSATSWQYGATPMRTGQVPFVGGPSVWSVAEISNGGSVSGSGNAFTIFRCGMGMCPSPGGPSSGGGSLTGITIGAIAHIAVTHTIGHIVVNTATGDTMYRVPFASQTHIEGAAFSPGEDTVYVIGFNTLIVANSSSGATHQTKTFGDTVAYGILRDEQRPWIYLFTVAAGRQYQLRILDRQSLATIAVVRAPVAANFNPSEGLDLFRLVMDPSAGRLYVVATSTDALQFSPGSRIISYGVPAP